MRLLVTLLGVALLGATFSPAHVEPALVHVRWTVHHRDLVATAAVDIHASHDSVVNVPGLFPMTERKAREQLHPRVRIVVAGKTLFDRALTRDEARRLGDIERLHVANDVRGAGERDLDAGGTAMLQYRASPPGYRIVRAVVVPPFGRGSRTNDCARKGWFELERSSSYRDVTARIVQQGDSFDCIFARPNRATMTIASGERTVYIARATVSPRGDERPRDAAGALLISDGPAFIDFEGTGAPAVVLSGSTGGAHCCFRTHVFTQTAPDAYADAVHTWGNGKSYPVLLRDARSGEILFGSSNDAFSYYFSGYANTVEPVQIFAFERGRFLDVTPDFPDVVRAHADRILNGTRGMLRGHDVFYAKPAVGAYLADMSTIGRAAEGWHTVVRACTGRDCPRHLADVREGLRYLKYRWDDRPARR